MSDPKDQPDLPAEDPKVEAAQESQEEMKLKHC